MVSSEISSDLFGTHTDLQFKAANRDHINETPMFIPHSGREIKLKYYQEKPRNGDSALVQVEKLTVIEDQSVKLIHAKVNNGSIRQLKQPPFIFYPFSKPELGDVEIRGWHF